MKTTKQLLADTTSSSNSALNAKAWLKQILVDAKQKLFFNSVAGQYDLPPGTKDLVVPYRTAFLSSMSDTTTEGGAVTFTAMNNLTGVTFTPSIHSYGIAISNHALRVNAVNLISAARTELTEYYSNTVDSAIATALSGATDATSTARGAQTVFGGDASSTATLASGDTLTPDVIADAKQRLMSKICKYWSGGSESNSSQNKNPWYPEPNQPFVLFIAPEQENALLKDSQFVNAAEYGGNEVVLNGEIGRYLGIKVITTDNVPSASNWGSSSNLAGHTCLLVKSKVAVGVAWGQRPKLRAFEYESELEQRLILEMAYDVKTIHNDAVVKIKVADE